ESSGVCSSGRPVLYGHNITDNIGSDFLSGSGPFSCDTVTPSPMVHEAPATTFVNYQTGDYHLQAGSLAIAGGASSCVAGGASPCVPPNDFVGTVRPTSGSQDVGAYVFVGTGFPIVSFSPSPLNFGTVAVSTPATLTDMLTNIGTGSLTCSPATITGTNASVFVIVSTTCGSSLAGGASCSYTIRATPTAASLQTANLTLTDNASGSPHQLPLSVTGGSPAATFSPASLSFGTVP